VKSIYNWERDYTLDDLRQMVIDNDWSSVTLRWGTAFFKKVDGQIDNHDLGYHRGAEIWVYYPID
jgi:hypothetical protein